MENILIKIQFKGTDFYGSQKQKSKKTVQGEIEKALKNIFKKNIKTICCSRTDRGVHAKEFFLNFNIAKLTLNLCKFKKALNYYLNRNIRVLSVKKVSKNFNSRYNVKYKIYRYYIYNGEILSPFKRGFVYHYPYKLNFIKMEKSLKNFVGEKDFRNFSVKGEAKTTICRVFNMKLRRKGKLFYIEIKADRFLYKMVRKIVGTILMIGRGKIRPEEIKSIFEGKIKSGQVVPGEGLYLWKVEFRLPV